MIDRQDGRGVHAAGELMDELVKRFRLNWSGADYMAWRKPDSDGRQMVRALFQGAHGLTNDEVDNLRGDVDQALHQTMVCLGCNANQRTQVGDLVGIPDCPLAREGSKQHYLVPIVLGKGDSRTAFFAVSRCDDPIRRQTKIAERLGTMKNIGGGLRAVQISGKDER